MKHTPHTAIPLADDVALHVTRNAPSIELTSPYQHIAVDATPRFGRLYTLDGDAMASEQDEFIIHESLAHLAALSHPAPARAIVLGGGDGGSTRELLKHPSVAHVTIAELDPGVVDTIARHFPTLPAGAFGDPRVSVRYGDAAATLAAYHAAGARFDLILFDLTQSEHPACAHLHSENFLRICAASLTPQGIVHVQLGSPFYQRQQVATVFRRLKDVFASVTPALIDIPLYGGPWLLARATRALAPEPDLATLAQRLADRHIARLRYYNPALHLACSALPNYVLDSLAS
ncbi:fused MFS/spermidine synthase [Zoogloea sp.]|uniref:fused MFS/spermidine synthase n=1 Tax=Zoogloea sp. TaxID=49181 RepID=UPI0035B0F43D